MARVARLWRISQGSRPRSSASRTMSAVSSAAPLEMPPRAMLTLAAARAGASLTPSPTMPVGPWRASSSAIAVTLSAGSRSGALLADAQLAGHGRGRPGVVAGEHDGLEAQVVQLGQHAGGLGTRPVGQADPAQRAGARPSGPPPCRPRSSARPSWSWNSGRQRPCFVDVAMAAQVVFDGVDPAAGAPAGDRAVVVGDRHVQAPAPGVAGDRLAQDVPAAVPQRRGDPHHAVLVLVARVHRRPRPRPAGPGSASPSCRRPGPAAGRSPRGTRRRGSGCPPAPPPPAR